MANSQAISVENLSLVAHNNTPVITTELLAQLYVTEQKHIQQNFSRNAERFIEGKHFIKLQGADLRDFRLQVTNSHAQNLQPSLRGVQISPKTRHLILWTERGAARHAKMLDTDQAWEVFEKLEDCYFTKKPAEQFALTNGQHYVVAQDGVVIYHKVLSDRTAKGYLQPALPPVDALAKLKADLGYFIAPENPRLEMDYCQAQDALTCLTTVINALERNGLQLGLMYQQTQFVSKLLSSYWTRLDELSSHLISIRRMASVQQHPSIVTMQGVRFG
jgi:hypothetical protein